MIQDADNSPAEKTGTNGNAYQSEPGGKFKKGNPGRPPSKGARIAAIMEGLRKRFKKETAEEAISEAVATCAPEDLRYYVALVTPKQEDPDLPQGEMTVTLRMVGSPAELARPAAAQLPEPESK